MYIVYVCINIERRDKLTNRKKDKISIHNYVFDDNKVRDSNYNTTAKQARSKEKYCLNYVWLKNTWLLSVTKKFVLCNLPTVLFSFLLLTSKKHTSILVVMAITWVQTIWKIILLAHEKMLSLSFLTQTSLPVPHFDLDGLCKHSLSVRCHLGFILKFAHQM